MPKNRNRINITICIDPSVGLILSGFLFANEKTILDCIKENDRLTKRDITELKHIIQEINQRFRENYFES